MRLLPRLRRGSWLTGAPAIGVTFGASPCGAAAGSVVDFTEGRSPSAHQAAEPRGLYMAPRMTQALLGMRSTVSIGAGERATVRRLSTAQQVLAFTETLLLAVWLGSMIFFSFAVAPSAF